MRILKIGQEAYEIDPDQTMGMIRLANKYSDPNGVDMYIQTTHFRVNPKLITLLEIMVDFKRGDKSMDEWNNFVDRLASLHMDTVDVDIPQDGSRIPSEFYNKDNLRDKGVYSAIGFMVLLGVLYWFSE